MLDSELIDLNQVAVERRIHDLRTVLVELASDRLNPDTAHFVAAETAELSSCLTALQMILSHIAESEGRGQKLRVVK